jgi:hypothetical protein
VNSAQRPPGVHHHPGVPRSARQHREQTRRLLATASANGQLRLAEMNQQVLDNLGRIIGALEADHGEADDGQKVADAG